MSDDVEPIRINFSGVEKRKPYQILPPGKYVVEITDYSEDEAGDEAKNPGAKMINWEFTVESTEDGEEFVNTRVRDPETKKSSVEEIKVAGRRVFDRMVMVEAMYPRIMEFLEACWYDTSGEMEIWPDQMVGNRLIIQTGIQRGQRDKRTNERYPDRPRVNKFIAHPEEAPMDETPAPAPEAASEPEPETKSKAQVQKDEEATV
jgi:hypothetical protein